MVQRGACGVNPPAPKTSSCPLKSVVSRNRTCRVQFLLLFFYFVFICRCSSIHIEIRFYSQKKGFFRLFSPNSLGWYEFLGETGHGCRSPRPSTYPWTLSLSCAITITPLILCTHYACKRLLFLTFGISGLVRAWTTCWQLFAASRHQRHLPLVSMRKGHCAVRSWGGCLQPDDDAALPAQMCTICQRGCPSDIQWLP